MSDREVVQVAIADQLMGEPKFNAPYGVLTGISKDNRYRTVTFGISRTLDAEIRVYGPHFILLRWETAIRKLPRHGSQKFTSITDLMKFLKETFL